MNEWIMLIVGVVFGSLVSGVVFLLAVGKWYIGSLRIDTSIPEEPYWFMEISSGGADRLKKLNIVLLRVRRENYIPGEGPIPELKSE